MGHYKLGTFEREGLLVTLDAIKPTTSDEFWPSLSASLDAAHAILKETFFGLLKSHVVEECGPTWETP